MHFRFRYLAVMVSCSFGMVYGASKSAKAAEKSAYGLHVQADVDGVVQAMSKLTVKPNLTVYQAVADRIVESWCKDGYLTREQKYCFRTRLLYEIITPEFETNVNDCIANATRPICKEDLNWMSYEVLTKLYDRHSPDSDVDFKSKVFVNICTLVQDLDEKDVDWSDSNDIGICVIATVTMFLLQLWRDLDTYIDPDNLDEIAKDSDYQSEVLPQIFKWIILNSQARLKIRWMLERIDLMKLNAKQRALEIFHVYPMHGEGLVSYKQAEKSAEAQTVQSYRWSSCGFNGVARLLTKAPYKYSISNALYVLAKLFDHCLMKDGKPKSTNVFDVLETE